MMTGRGRMCTTTEYGLTEDSGENGGLTLTGRESLDSQEEEK